MTIVTAVCPHPTCRAEPVPLTVVRNHKQLMKGNIISCCVCPVCERPVSLILAPGADGCWSAEKFLKYAAYDDHDLLRISGWRIREIIPAPSAIGAPEHTPPDVAKLYRAAHAALRRKENEAAAVLFRRTLERALALLDGDAPGPLPQRIDLLAGAGRIPGEVRQWAQEIDVLADEAPQRLEAPGETDLLAIIEFTDAFLLSAFTVRAKYEARQSRTNSTALDVV